MGRRKAGMEIYDFGISLILVRERLVEHLKGIKTIKTDPVSCVWGRKTIYILLKTIKINRTEGPTFLMSGKVIKVW